MSLRPLGVEGSVDVKIGTRVRSRRQALGQTQEELASLIGVTHQHVSRIESGRAAPSLELLVKLSRTFGATTDFLLTGDDRPAVDVRAAIRSDGRLSTSAKRHLIGLVDELVG